MLSQNQSLKYSHSQRYIPVLSVAVLGTGGFEDRMKVRFPGEIILDLESYLEEKREEWLTLRCTEKAKWSQAEIGIILSQARELLGAPRPPPEETAQASPTEPVGVRPHTVSHASSLLKCGRIYCCFSHQCVWFVMAALEMYSSLRIPVYHVVLALWGRGKVKFLIHLYWCLVSGCFQRWLFLQVTRGRNYVIQKNKV